MFRYFSDGSGDDCVTFQDLGSLGELIGSIAVLATLVYLAIQTRQNKVLLEENQKHIRAQTYQMRTDAGRAVTQLAIQIPEVRAYLLARAEGTEASTEQTLAFNMMIQMAFRHAENVFYQYKLGVLDEDALNGPLELAQSTATFEANKRVWQERKNIHPADFVKWMDEKIAMYELQGS